MTMTDTPTTNTSNLYLREPVNTSIAELLDTMDSPGERIVVNSDAISFDLIETKTVTFRDHDIVVPVTENSLAAFAAWADVPEAFLGRVPTTLRQTILQTLVPTKGSAHVLLGKVEAADGSGENIDVLREIQNPESKVVDPRRLIEVASRVIAPEAQVVDFWTNTSDFRLDVIAPENFDRGIGGDRQVGDLTRGGIRMGQDRKHNLAPWVQPYMYRLICTNGMETPDVDLKIDARGATLEDVMAEFGRMAEMAFSQVEGRIRHFYDLREQTVVNAERTLIRLAGEQGLPQRTVMQLVERIPSVIDDNSVTMFDLVNLMTNHANAPGTKEGVRRKLEVAGGNLVSEHAARCGHCQSKLN